MLLFCPDLCSPVLHHPPTALLFFFFNDTATTEIYTLSLHDALPIFSRVLRRVRRSPCPSGLTGRAPEDRKSTRLNSSHLGISYAVFCLKKKKRRKSGDSALPRSRAPRRRKMCVRPCD